MSVLQVQGGIAEVEMEDDSLSGGSEDEEQQTESAPKLPSSK